jgi:hypothetical protein
VNNVQRTNKQQATALKMVRVAVLAAVALALSAGGVAAARVKYNTAGGPKEGTVNVHIVPHTHDGE